MCLDGKPSTNYVHPSRDLAPTVLRDRTVAPSVRRTGRGASQRCFRRPGDRRQHRHRVRRPRKHGGRRQLECPATTGAGATASPNLINKTDVLEHLTRIKPGTWKKQKPIGQNPNQVPQKPPLFFLIKKRGNQYTAMHLLIRFTHLISPIHKSLLRHIEAPLP